MMGGGVEGCVQLRGGGVYMRVLFLLSFMRVRMNDNQFDATPAPFPFIFIFPSPRTRVSFVIHIHYKAHGIF